MDNPYYFDTKYLLEQRGIENIYGFTYELDSEAGAREAKAWFLGTFHGCNEKKRFNPYSSLAETVYYEAYERGFFDRWRRRMKDEGKDWTKEIDKV